MDQNFSLSKGLVDKRIGFRKVPSNVGFCGVLDGHLFFIHVGDDSRVVGMHGQVEDVFDPVVLRLVNRISPPRKIRE